MWDHLVVRPEVRQELESLLSYARAARHTIDHLEDTPADVSRVDGEHIRSTTWAYVGGSMTTLVHLDLITSHEHMSWWHMFGEVLGDSGQRSV